MIAPSITRLEYLCRIIPPLLAAANEETFALKPSPDRWSKKEILGHLIDSAANNHHRFVRCQFEDTTILFYDQDNWIACNYYQQRPLKQLIEFWTVYNQQLATLLKYIPPAALQQSFTVQDGTQVTLAFLAEDYVMHLEHHLQQIVTYDAFASEGTGKPF